MLFNMPFTDGKCKVHLASPIEKAEGLVTPEELFLWNFGVEYADGSKDTVTVGGHFTTLRRVTRDVANRLSDKGDEQTA